MLAPYFYMGGKDLWKALSFMPTPQTGISSLDNDDHVVDLGIQQLHGWVT